MNKEDEEEEDIEECRNAAAELATKLKKVKDKYDVDYAENVLEYLAGNFPSIENRVKTTRPGIHARDFIYTLEIKLDSKNCNLTTAEELDIYDSINEHLKVLATQHSIELSSLKWK